MFGGEAKAAAIAANCSFDRLFDTCGDPHHGQPVYMQWMHSFACLMDGNWYSTQSAGKCSGDAITDDCWWRMKSSEVGARVVNASCADAKVVAAVRARHPACWDACSPADARNATSEVRCFVRLCAVCCVVLLPLVRTETLVLI